MRWAAPRLDSKEGKGKEKEREKRKRKRWFKAGEKTSGDDRLLSDNLRRHLKPCEVLTI